MNAEYSTLQSIYNFNEHNIISRENARFFLNSLYRKCYVVAVTMKRFNMAISLENAVKVSHNLFDKEEERENVIAQIKSIYNNDNFIPLQNPIAELRKNYHENFSRDMGEYFSQPRTGDEIREKLKTGLVNLASTNLFQDVDSLENMVDDYIDSPVDSEFKKYRLNNMWLRELFGEYLYSQLYNITAVPGGYKTTILHNIMLDLLESGNDGLLVSLEDRKSFASRKMIASKCNMAKLDVINKEVDLQHIKNTFSNIKGTLYIADASRTAEELYDLIASYIVSFGVKFIGFDFLQAVSNEKGQDDTASVNNLAQVFLKINKEFNVPIISTSQTTKDKVQKVLKDNYQLGGGDEKSSSKVFDFLRYAYYLMPYSKTMSEDGRDLEIIRMTCDKATIGNGKHKAWLIFIDGATGVIHSVKRTDYILQNNKENRE